MTATVPRGGSRLPGTDRGTRRPPGCWDRRWPGSHPSAAFSASANLRTATRRFSSASTPLVLTVAMSCTLLFSTTTQDHAVSQQRQAALSGELAITSSGPGLPPATLADVRATRGVRSAVALTPTTLGPSLGSSDDTLPAEILDGGQGGGLDAGVTSGSLTALHGDAIALGRQRADAAHAHVGDRVAVMLGDGTRTHATVAAIYSRALAFGDALLAPELAAGHQTSPLLGTILVQTDRPTAVARRLRALAARYPGLRVSDRASLTTATDSERETNRWLGPLFVVIIFAFTSIAVVNTLVMIALQRGRELALLRLVGATRSQVRSMARWEAALIITIGLGSVWRLRPRRCCRSATLSLAASAHTCRSVSSRRSSVSPHCWRYWPWRCRRGGRCARGRSRQSDWRPERQAETLAVALARHDGTTGTADAVEKLAADRAWSAVRDGVQRSGW